VAAGLTLKAFEAGLGLKWLIGIGILSTLVASHFALAVTNWMATLLAKPDPSEDGFFDRNSN
jgi:hypothetical protein